MTTGCANIQHPHIPPPAIPSFYVAYAVQPNTEVQKYQLEQGISAGDVAFRSATLGIYRVPNDFAPPTTQHYFGNDCDKFYLNETEASEHCSGYQYLDEAYAEKFRQDIDNHESGQPYHILLINEEVVQSQFQGDLAGTTSPREDEGSENQRCSYIFDQQITHWLNTLRDNNLCGYSDDRKAYISKLLSWAVPHELGRQIGGLHGTDDLNHPNEHNTNMAGYDAMRRMDPCDPVMDLIQDRFCTDDDPIDNNSCVDRLRKKFNLPPK